MSDATKNKAQTTSIIRACGRRANEKQPLKKKRRAFLSRDGDANFTFVSQRKLSLYQLSPPLQQLATEKKCYIWLRSGGRTHYCAQQKRHAEPHKRDGGEHLHLQLYPMFLSRSFLPKTKTRQKNKHNA